MAKTLLAMGAHYDDCVYGVPGIMLKAARKNYRVVILTLIGDYSKWPPAKGRGEEIVKGSIEISKEYGAEMRYLNFASHRYDVNLETKRAVAEAISDLQPDVALNMWPHDHHHDHTVASTLCKIAMRHGGRVLDGKKVSRPRRIYHYDNGPRHTIGFEPDTFVDVSDEWPNAIHWLGRFMALVRGEEYDPDKRDGAQRGKETLAAYRGMTCGVRYAEAVWAAGKSAEEIL